MYFDRSLDRWVATVYRGAYQKPKAIYGPAHDRTGAGKQAAKDKRTEWLNALARGEVVEPVRGNKGAARTTIENWGSTVGDWGVYWLDQLLAPEVAAGRLKDHTLALYRHYWVTQVAPRQIARVKLAGLKRSHIVVLWDEWKAAGLSDAMRFKAKVILGTAMKAAVDRADYTGLQGNPVWAFKPTNEKYVPKRRSAPDQVATQTVMAAVAGERQELMMHLGWRLGLRIGEMSALQWQDVDLAKGEIIVRRHTARVVGKGLVVYPGVKNGDPDSYKIKYIDPQVWGPVLQAHRVRQLEFALKNRQRWQGPEPTAPEAWLLPTQKGTVQDPQEMYRWFKATVAAAGYPELFPHKMRHDFFSVNLNAGLSLWEVAQLGGHSDTRTTESVYAHVMPSRMRDISNKADEWVDSRAAYAVEAI